MKLVKREIISKNNNNFQKNKLQIFKRCKNYNKILILLIHNHNNIKNKPYKEWEK